MLRRLPEVEEVQEVAANDADAKGPRFLKETKDTRGRTPGPMQRWLVLLRPLPPPEAATEGTTAVVAESADTGSPQTSEGEESPES